jgi:hypothetical protein
MLQVFRQCCLDAYSRKGLAGLLLLLPSAYFELLFGMLAERFSPDTHTNERLRLMQKTLRTSLISLFLAFILFGLAWLFYSRLDDPLSWWDGIRRFHPGIDATFRVMLWTGLVAFLLILLMGVPILLSVLRNALRTKQQAVLKPLAIVVGMLVLFLVVVLLYQPVFERFDRNGGLLGIFCLLELIIIAVLLVRVVLRGEASQRVLRFALWPATLLTFAMVIEFVATLIESLLLAFYTPLGLSGTFTPDWIIAGLMLTAATCTAIVALWRGVRSRPQRPAAI